MKILAVDDEYNQLGMLLKSIRETVPEAEITGFQNPAEALAWAKEERPDIAFLDIQMPVMDGIALGKELKKHNPQVNLIYVTGYYEEYVLDAIPLHFSGYLQKPATAEAIKYEIEHPRYPLPKPQTKKKLTVQCFGEFEVFCDGKAVHFSRSKTKELFAYLIDRKGARVNGNMICAAIYEDDFNEENNKSGLRKCVADMRAALKAINAEDVFIKGFDSYAIDTSLVECDYYDWEKNEAYAVRSFHGEYMSQYSWAEATLGALLSEEK